MKFKVGDKVRVRSFESLISEFGNKDEMLTPNGLHIVKEMRQLCGCIVTITSVDCGVYMINNNAWCWNDYCFEPYVVNKSTGTITLEIKLRKCWVSVGGGWFDRWNILGTNACIYKLGHDKIPDVNNLELIEYPEIKFDDPNAPKQMTIAEIESALGYKIKIKE